MTALTAFCPEKKCTPKPVNSRKTLKLINPRKDPKTNNLKENPRKKKHEKCKPQENPKSDVYTGN